MVLPKEATKSEKVETKRESNATKQCWLYNAEFSLRSIVKRYYISTWWSFRQD